MRPNHIYENISLKPYNTFGIEAKARYFVEIDTLEDLENILAEDAWQKTPKLILGGGSNLLFTQDYSGLVIKMMTRGIQTIAEDTNQILLKVAAGESWHDFVLYCVERNYAGVENLSLIPGTVGAAPIQNIGAYGVELKEIFEELSAIHIVDGTRHCFKNKECRFAYRDSIFKTSHKGQYIITDVTLRLSKKPQLNLNYGALRETLEQLSGETFNVKTVSDAVIHIRRHKLPDPKEIGNAGSFFKNPVISPELFAELNKQYPQMPHYLTEDNEIKIPAAWLIEQCGWKGKRLGNIGVHDKQALVLVNHGGGKGRDIQNLSVEIQNSIFAKFSIRLTPEVNMV